MGAAISSIIGKDQFAVDLIQRADNTDITTFGKKSNQKLLHYLFGLYVIIKGI
jgi:hypothetical protein